jgi:hypothetical protein
MSVLNYTNTNTAAISTTEKGEYKSDIENLKPLITTSLSSVTTLLRIP